MSYFIFNLNWFESLKMTGSRHCPLLGRKWRASSMISQYICILVQMFCYITIYVYIYIYICIYICINISCPLSEWRWRHSSKITHYISNRKFCCLFGMIAMVHQNSPTVEVWWEKIEGNLRKANKELSMDFRWANTEPSVNFRRAKTEPSVHFRRANTEPSVHLRRANTET